MRKRREKEQINTTEPEFPVPQILPTKLSLRRSPSKASLDLSVSIGF